MKKIFRLKNLILVTFTVIFLELFFFTGKNTPPAYGEAKLGEILFKAKTGHFRADNGVYGGHCCGTGHRLDPDGEPCADDYLGAGGVMGDFTEDSACKEAYGTGAKAGKFIEQITSDKAMYICDLDTNTLDKIECVGSLAPQPAAPDPADPAAPKKEPLPPPPGPPCAKWKGGDPNSGVCEMVATSLFQGKNKSDGDISTDPGQFIVRILAIILSLAGGIAILLIISAGYKIMTSKGKPEAIQQGRDQLISAIVGLVFIIFSFVIFQLVVTDILKIPGITK